MGTCLIAPSLEELRVWNSSGAAGDIYFLIFFKLFTEDPPPPPKKSPFPVLVPGRIGGFFLYMYNIYI